jgi:two-component system sensor histidine kinase UhpB
VDITIEQQGREIHCTIKDDGAGFDVDAVLARGGKRGLGLLGMRERANAVGGNCNIRSALGLGTSIEVIVPLTNTASME